MERKEEGKIQISETENLRLDQQTYTLFMQAPVGIGIFKGKSHVIDFANAPLLKLWGKGPEIVGKPLVEVFPEMTPQGYIDLLTHVYETGNPYYAYENIANIVRNGKNEIVYLNFVYQPYYELDGRITGVMAIANEVTEQVVARKKVEKSEQKFRNVIEQAIAPILILKGEDLVLEVANQALLDLWKVGREAIGKPFLQILPEMHDQIFLDLLLDVYHNGTSHYGYEVPAIFYRGINKKETVYCNFAYQPYRELNGAITGVIILASNVTDQVMVRKKLEESDERLRIAVESAEMGTWDYNPATNNYYFSYRARQFFGFDPGEEVSIYKIRDSIIKTDKLRVLKAIQSALKPYSGGNFDIEFALINHLDKKQRTIKAKGKAFFENDLAYRFTGTLLDVTREVKAREVQQKLFTLVNNSIELMSVLELDGRNSYINKAGMEMLGFDNEQHVAETPISELHSPEDLALVENEVLPSVINNGSWSGMMLVRHLKTKDIFPVFNNTVRIDDPLTGKPMAIGAVMRDMRSELAVQHALAESEKKFRNLVMLAPVGICILKGKDFIVEIANQHYLDIAGVRQEELVGKTFWDNYPNAKKEGFDTILLNVLETGKPYYRKEHKVVLIKNPAITYIDFTFEPIVEADGSITRIMEVIIDVTDKVLARKKIEESEKELQRRVEERTAALQESNRELQHINSELEQFTYVSSHDLQEPLRKILMFTEMVKERNGNTLDEVSRGNLNKVSEAASRMSASIKSLLEYTHLKKEEQFVTVDLNIIIREILVDLELAIAQKHASIKYGTLPVIQGIPHQLHQLFYNLINNALKFSKPGLPPEINIEVKHLARDESTPELGFDHRRKYIQISVTDNGIGFEPEYAEKIFIIFQRLHNRTAYDGTGIGLSLCRKVVENHHGFIRAFSLPGEGATFYITLPDY